MISCQVENERYRFVKSIAQCLEMLFVEFAETIEISGDSVLRMCLLKFLENDTALDHELRSGGKLGRRRRCEERWFSHLLLEKTLY